MGLSSLGERVSIYRDSGCFGGPAYLETIYARIGSGGLSAASPGIS